MNAYIDTRLMNEIDIDAVNDTCNLGSMSRMLDEMQFAFNDDYNTFITCFVLPFEEYVKLSFSPFSASSNVVGYNTEWVDTEDTALYKRWAWYQHNKHAVSVNDVLCFVFQVDISDMFYDTRDRSVKSTIDLFDVLSGTRQHLLLTLLRRKGIPEILSEIVNLPYKVEEFLTHMHGQPLSVSITDLLPYRIIDDADKTVLELFVKVPWSVYFWETFRELLNNFHPSLPENLYEEEITEYVEDMLIKGSETIHLDKIDINNWASCIEEYFNEIKNGSFDDVTVELVKPIEEYAYKELHFDELPIVKVVLHNCNVATLDIHNFIFDLNVLSYEYKRIGDSAIFCDFECYIQYAYEEEIPKV